MRDANVIAISAVLTALLLGARQALFTGIIPTGIIAARGAPIFKVVSRWTICFLIVLTIGTTLTHIGGAFIFSRFSESEYLLVFFIGIVSIISLWDKQNLTTKLLSNNNWIYFIAVIQGISATENLGFVYALTRDVSALLLGTSALLYALTYCLTVFIFTLIIDLISKSQSKARSIINFLLALSGILVSLVHYFFGIR